jgi:hypothetical protein
MARAVASASGTPRCSACTSRSRVPACVRLHALSLYSRADRRMVPRVTQALKKVVSRMKRLILVACVLTTGVLVIGCGSTPAAPTPPAVTTPIVTTARANVVSEGPSSWVSCLPAIASFAGSCQFQQGARNTGAGCASGVSGTLALLDAQQNQIGSLVSLLPGVSRSRALRPNEAFRASA